MCILSWVEVDFTCVWIRLQGKVIQPYINSYHCGANSSEIFLHSKWHDMISLSIGAANAIDMIRIGDDISHEHHPANYAKADTISIQPLCTYRRCSLMAAFSEEIN